jgi:hypothetical protein
MDQNGAGGEATSSTDSKSENPPGEDSTTPSSDTTMDQNGAGEDSTSESSGGGDTTASGSDTAMD